MGIKRSVICAVAVLACACGPSLQSGSPEGVRLNAEPDVASVGDTVLLTLTNASADTIGYNLCTTGLERQANGAWQAVPPSRVCTMELRTLAPGQTAEYPLDLPADLQPGTYRFHTSIEQLGSGQREPVRSDALQLTG